MNESIKIARLDQTRREITRLRKELENWLRRYNKNAGSGVENYGRHDSQLKAIKGEIDAAAQIISKGLDEVDLVQTVGSVYAKCAQHDRQLVWLWRVFDFFRERFAQRDVEGSATERMLRAADDVIWSCYSPFFTGAEMAARREPPPLPYIETGYSPAALRRDQTPGSLIKRGKELDPLRECLKRMPIPLLQLPPVGLNSVWALALIGHEVGHFIQPAVGEDSAYVSVFRGIVEEAAKGVPGCDAEEAEHWGDWSPEVFADWYFTVTMGPWAVWVMGQFELADEGKMLEQRDGYPSRLSRMALLAALADNYLPGAGARMLLRLGIDAEAEAQADKSVAREMETVRAVCRAITTAPLPGELGELSDRVRFKVEDYATDPEDIEKSGDVDKWAKTLRGEWSMESRRDVRAARLIVAGAAQAWSELMPRWSELRRGAPEGRGPGAGGAGGEEGTTYPAEAEEINARALERIAATAEEGKRVSVTGRHVERPGKALGDYLMSAEAALLEAD